jgi:hypothetical protein
MAVTGSLASFADVPQAAQAHNVLKVVLLALAQPTIRRENASSTTAR